MFFASHRNDRLVHGAFLLIGFVSLFGCSHPDRVRYDQMFSPPSSYLDVEELPLEIGSVDQELVDRAITIAAKSQFDLRFVGAVRKEQCGGFCYVFREPLADHVYVVFAVDGEQKRLLSWFTFSQMESGRPAE